VTRRAARWFRWGRTGGLGDFPFLDDEQPVDLPVAHGANE